MTSTMASTALLKVVVPASKVVTALEQHGPVLSMCIHRKRIDLGVASPPSYYGRNMIDEIDTLTSIPTSERKISMNSIQQLQEVVDEHDISGFVIAWPLHSDTGKMGASCGRVLYTLESILHLSETTSSNNNNNNDRLLSSKRPACLWHPFYAPSNNNNGDRMIPPSPPPEDDEWGRCPLHARISNQRIYKASIERYNEDEKMDSESVWKSFAEANWPHLVERQRRDREATTATSSNNLISDWKEGGATAAVC